MATKNQKNLKIGGNISQKVPLKKKFTFASGMFGTQIYNSTQAGSTAWFWLNIMGVDNIAYSIVMLVFYNLWNAINDPIFGWASDNTRTKWGRRVPYIRFVSPIWFVANVFLFFPLVNTEFSLIIWFSIWILVFDGCYTIVANSYNSLLGELSYDTTERASINTLAMVLGLLGNAVGLGVPLLVKENLYVFQTFIVIGGLIGLTALLVPGFFIKERSIPPVETPLNLITALKASVKNRTFLAACGWYFAIEFTGAILLANVIFYATFILGATGWNAILLMLFFLLANIPGFIMFAKFQSKHGIRTTAYISTIIYAFGMLGLLFAQEYWQVAATLALAGFGIAGPFIVNNVMTVEAADYDEIRTNRRREAMFFGTHSLLTKPAIGLAQAILATTLLVTGFVKDTVSPSTGQVTHYPQTAEALLGIRLIMGLFPFLMLIIVGLISLYFYPSSKETKEMKKQLSIIQSKKLETKPLS
ncbi:MAG: MFS transporter [Candidatus Lokiarchaeota archaeon]|nr:MFS transporter [Candidatus Lokiarchaeota archaeon]MBD3337622.1 MFS transporter [Candidatus Lokiarchaeota archaeon]